MSYPPFTLDEKRRLGWMTLAIQGATHVGNPAPIVERMRQRFSNPQPGDWVAELSTLSRLLEWPPWADSPKWDGQFVRYLRTDERPLIEDGDIYGYEKVFVCELPDGSEFTWRDARLGVVPLEGIPVEGFL